MPKLGVRKISQLGSRTPLEVALHYFPDTQKFMVIAPPEYRFPDNKGTQLSTVYSSGRNYIGTIGNTEAEALKNMVAHIKFYDETKLEKTKMIYLKVDKGAKRYSSTLNSQIYENSDTISFEFHVGFAMKLPGGVKHYHHDIYGYSTSHEIYAAEKEYTIIPWTQELQDACEKTIRNMRHIKKALNDTMLNPEYAINELLSNGSFFTINSITEEEDNETSTAG